MKVPARLLSLRTWVALLLVTAVLLTPATQEAMPQP